MLDQLIKKVFESRNASHLKHWKTTSFSEHQALGEFYENSIELIDKYVEAYVGAFGSVEEIPEDVENITKLIKEDIIWLTANREKIAKNIPALENILDELTGQYLSTLFKLERLR